MTHEIVESSLQAEEEIWVGRLGHVRNCAVGQNQIIADNGVDGETILISLEGVPYR